MKESFADVNPFNDIDTLKGYILLQLQLVLPVQLLLFKRPDQRPVARGPCVLQGDENLLGPSCESIEAEIRVNLRDSRYNFRLVVLYNGFAAFVALVPKVPPLRLPIMINAQTITTNRKAAIAKPPPLEPPEEPPPSPK